MVNSIYLDVRGKHLEKLEPHLLNIGMQIVRPAGRGFIVKVPDTPQAWSCIEDLERKYIRTSVRVLENFANALERRICAKRQNILVHDDQTITVTGKKIEAAIVESHKIKEKTGVDVSWKDILSTQQSKNAKISDPIEHKLSLQLQSEPIKLKNQTLEIKQAQPIINNKFILPKQDQPFILNEVRVPELSQPEIRNEIKVEAQQLPDTIINNEVIVPEQSTIIQSRTGGKKKITFTRDSEGKISSATIEEKD